MSRSEDVEEALEWIKRYSAPTVYGISEEDMESKIREVRFAFRALRSRLEEVEEERDRWEDEADHNLSIIRDLRDRALANQKAARRRADRLEEAVREADRWGLNLAEGFLEQMRSGEIESDLPDHKIDFLYGRVVDAYDRLHSALDSREDEGETGQVPRTAYIDSDCQGCKYEAPDMSLAYRNYDCPVHGGGAPVHADEPEGEDAARYADSNMKLNAGYNRLARRADQLEDEGDEDRGFIPGSFWHAKYPPTDEPVSGEEER